MADVSSVESLPKLSDVLLALTESQQLLLAKVRTLSQESGRPSMLDASPRVDVVPLLGIQTQETQTVDIRHDEIPALPADDHSHTTDSWPTRDSPPLPHAEPVTTTLSSHEITAPVDASEQLESKDRNYNFFDDLDAKLARMDDPAGREA